MAMISQDASRDGGRWSPAAPRGSAGRWPSGWPRKARGSRSGTATRAGAEAVAAAIGGHPGAARHHRLAGGRGGGGDARPRPSAGSTCWSAAPGSPAPTVPVVDFPVAEFREVFADQRLRPLPLQQGGGAGDAAGRLRADRQHRLDRRQGGQPERLGLLGLEGGGDRLHQVARQGAGRPRGSWSTPSRPPRCGRRSSTRCRRATSTSCCRRSPWAASAPWTRSRRHRDLGRERGLRLHHRRGLRRLGGAGDLLSGFLAGGLGSRYRPQPCPKVYGIRCGWKAAGKWLESGLPLFNGACISGSIL